jgi:hypothetical protein
MQFGGLALLGLVVASSLVSPRAATAASLDIAAVPPAIHLSEPAAALTADARYVAEWALQSNDNQNRPFAVVDKKAARIYVFDAEGGLVGAANALLGQAPGDHSVPGVGDGDLSRIPLADRTTPARESIPLRPSTGSTATRMRPPGSRVTMTPPRRRRPAE